jgi:hypothetical protein
MTELEKPSLPPDPALVSAVAEALGEVKLRRLDKRLLWLYGFTSVVAIFLTLLVSHQVDVNNQARLRFEQAVVANCVANQKNTESINNFITTLQQTNQQSSELSEKAKQEQAKLLEQAKLPIPECPPAALEK